MTLAAQRLQQAVKHLRKNDPILRDVIKEVGPCKIRFKRKRYLTLVQSIVSQQISGAAAKTILGRLEQRVAPHGIKPEVMSEFTIDELREVGVSRQKATYVLDLSEKVTSGEVKLSRLGRLSNQEVIDELTQVKGIGVWTAQMFLMFSLGRLDVLPTGDLGIQNAMIKNYNLRKSPVPERMKKIAAPWSPYQTVACWYMWKSLDELD